MRLKRTLIAWSLLAAAAALPVSAKEWRGIVPLVSNRADVERTLGRPAKQIAPDIDFFDLKNESVRVVYSAGPCTPGIAGEWHAAPGIVLSIEVTPKKDLLLKDAPVDVTTSMKGEDLHIVGRLVYVNKEEGVSVDTNAIDPEHERVFSIRYGPRAAENNLRCKSPEQ